MKSVATRDEYSQRPGPSNRTRFVQRARWLRDESKEFHDAIAKTREWWNATYPAYAIGRPSLPPDDQRIPLPAALASELDHVWNEQENIKPTQHALEAGRAWFEHLRRLCDRFWPSSDFPRGPQGFLHPAATFVMSCVIYEAKLVSEDLIGSSVMQPVRLSMLAADEAMNPKLSAEETRGDILAEAMRAAIADGHSLSIDEMRHALALAKQAAGIVLSERLKREHDGVR